MNSNKLISVIIPSYNSGKYLEKALKSVIKQSYKNLEIIIINDGSTDNTEEIVKNWQKKDKRIRYLEHKKNLGLSAARNNAIKIAKGEYFALLDADDVWLAQKIEIQLQKALRENADLVFSNWYFWEPEKEILKIFSSTPIKKFENLFYLFIKKNLGSPSTALIKKSNLAKIGLFNENLKSSEDYDLWLRFILNGMKIVFCEEPLAYIRQHSNQMSHNLYRMRITRLLIFKEIIKTHPIFLIKYPILTKKFFLLQIYKFICDFLRWLRIKSYD